MDRSALFYVAALVGWSLDEFVDTALDSDSVRPGAFYQDLEAVVTENEDFQEVLLAHIDGQDVGDYMHDFFHEYEEE